MSDATRWKFHRSVEAAKALKPRLQTGRAFHVTTVFRKSKMLAIGVNNYSRSHPRSKDYETFTKDYQPNTHSELSAVIRLGIEDCSDFTFFNIRIDNNGEVNGSCPCAGCRRLLIDCGSPRLFHSTQNGNMELYQY